MTIYLYAPTSTTRCWVYSTNTKGEYPEIEQEVFKNVEAQAINIHKKDNLDKALLLISLGLPHKEIEQIFGES